MSANDNKTTLLLGQYQPLAGPISGGMGSVYKVRHTGWNIDLAMKVPKPGMFDTPEKRAIFQRECETWMGLGLHPNTVSCFYVRDINGTPCVFSEWMDGGSLDDLIKSGELYDVEENAAIERILDIAIQFARGLQYSHEKKLIHQDVKPANVMLSKDGAVKVCDFGLANAIVMSGISSVYDPDADESLFVNGIGYTQSYASPEQLSMAAIKPMLTRRTDIYSWAVSVIEMFFGECVWMSGAVVGMSTDYYFEDGEIVIPEAMRGLLRHCLAINQEDRPHSFADVIGDPDPEGSKGFAPVEKNLLEIYRELCGKEYPCPLSKAASDSPDSLNNLALSFLDMADDRNAVDCWCKALALDKHHLQSVYNYDLYRWRKGEIQDLQFVCKLEELAEYLNTSDAARLMLQLYMERTDKENAKQWLEKLESFGEKRTVSDDLLQTIEGLQSDLDSKKLYLIEEDDYLCFTDSISPDGQIGLVCVHKLHGEDFMNCHVLRIADAAILSEFRVYDDCKICCICSDNQYAVLGFGDRIEMIDLFTGSTIKRYSDESFNHYTYYKKIEVSPDASFVMAAIGRQLFIWNVQTCECIMRIKEEEEIRDAAFSPDSKSVIYSQFRCDHACIKDIASDTLVGTYKHPQGEYIGSVCFTPDGRQVLAQGGDRLFAFDIESGQILYVIILEDDVREFQVSPDGKHIVTRTFYKGLYQIIDVKTHQCRRWFKGHNLTSFRFLNDRNIAVSVEAIETKMIPELGYRAEWEICRIHEFTEQSALEVQLAEYKAQVQNALDLKDVKKALELITLARLLPGCENEEELLDCKYKAAAFSRKVGINWVRRVDYLHIEGYNFEIISENGGLAAFMSDRNVKFVRLIDQTVISSFDMEKTWYPYKFCQDGKRFIASNTMHHREWRLYNSENGSYVQIIVDDDYEIRKMCFSPDIRNVFSCEKASYAFSNDDKCRWRVWDADNGKCVASHDLPSDEYYEMHLSPDAKRIMLWGKESICICDVATGEVVGSIDHSGAENKSHFNISPDGKNIVCPVGENKQAPVLRSSKTNCAELLLELESDSVFPLFTPDSNWLLSADKDNRIRIWNVSDLSCSFEINYQDFSANMAITMDSRYIVCETKHSFDPGLQYYEIDWRLDFPGWTDWDEDARPYLDIFLALHPNWTEDDFKQLITDLQYRGFGYIRPEGVRRQLESD